MKAGRGQARAGAWPGSFVATAASRRAIEAEQGRSVEEACCSGDGTGQRSTGRAREALMAGSGLAPLALLLCSAVQKQRREREEEERERREVNMFDSRFSQNIPWKLEKV